jgi:hypothetical protein
MTSTYPIGFPRYYSEWKGKLFYQVIASIQKNQKNASNLSINQLRKALPLKIYRKEIHNIAGQPYPNSCNYRTSTKISDFDRPGNNMVSETNKTFTNGLVNTIDSNQTTLTAENGSCNNSSSCYFSPQLNARRRCRSAGMTPRKFNIARNNDTYSSSTQQYLISRNRTIKQNEFNYIRKGNSGYIPGTGLAAANIYSPSGLTHCSLPLISSNNQNNTINYYWIDTQLYTATIPSGYYDVRSLNNAFQAQQILNNTYLTGPDGNKIFLLNISYDTQSKSIILIANTASETSYPSTIYSSPILDDNNNTFLNSGNYPATDPIITNLTPVYGATYLIVSDNFGILTGFFPGTYSGGLNNKSSFEGTLVTTYVPVYYKPNNPGFAVQGAVDSSTLTHRVKYNTVTNAASGLRSAYGNAAANALAYGVSEQAYTIKSAVGDKIKFTPVVNPKTGALCKKRYIYRM